MTHCENPVCANGRWYVGEGDTAKCWACEEATKEVRSILPLLYESNDRGKAPTTRGAYGMKHDVEDILGRYVSTEELVRAGQVTYARHTDEGGRTLGFYVKERFPLTWLWNDVEVRPKGAKLSEWSVYLQARAEKARRASRPASA